MYLQRWHGWCHNNLLPESQSQRVLCTPYNHAPCHFMQSHICKVYACLAVTCHLRLWQNDRGLLRATAVTRGWNGYRNKSQHRKLTLEKKILLPLQQGFEPATFRSQVRRSNHCAIPAQLHRHKQQAAEMTLAWLPMWGGGMGGGRGSGTKASGWVKAHSKFKITLLSYQKNLICGETYIPYSYWTSYIFHTIFQRYWNNSF